MTGGRITARSLPGGDPEGLGGHPHGALHLQLLVLGTPDQVLADLLQGLHVPENGHIFIMLQISRILLHTWRSG